MKHINKIMTSLLLGSSLVYGDIEIDSVGLHIGFSDINYKQEDNQGSIVLARPLDESFKQVEVYTLLKGVFDDKNLQLTINYIHSQNDDFKNDVLAVGVNQYFTFEKYNLYLGVLCGVGIMDWQFNPINNAKAIDTKASSFVGIAQIGAEYEITKTIFLGVNTKYTLSSYDTSLAPTNLAQTTITHNRGSSFSVGIRYKF